MTLVLIVLLVLFAVTIVAGFVLPDKSLYGCGSFPIWAIVLSLLLGVAVFMAGILMYSKSYEQGTCERRSVALERPTKFEVYGTFSWGCLVRTERGWVPVDNINGDGRAA